MLDMSAPPGSGGTWGDIIMLYSTSSKNLYAQKRDSRAFTSAGTMALKIWLGTLLSTNVYQGTTKVYFRSQLPSSYYAKFQSYAPETRPIPAR